MKKVGFIVANEIFRDEEYLEPKKILEKAGIKIVNIAKNMSICKGKLGYEFMPDLELENVNSKDFDAIVFIGGIGCKIYWHDEKAQEICKEMVEQNKILAAICSSVATLAFAGVLKGKKANSYESEREILTQCGTVLVDDDVKVDGKLVTATGPKAACKFGEEILKLLQN